MAKHRAGRAGGRLPPPPPGNPSPAEMVTTGVAADIIGKTWRTIDRWVDEGMLRGGQAFPGAHRWVDARHAVLIGVAAGRAHLIPARWRHLIPGAQQQPEGPAEGPSDPPPGL